MTDIHGVFNNAPGLSAQSVFPTVSRSASPAFKSLKLVNRQIFQFFFIVLIFLFSFAALPRWAKGAATHRELLEAVGIGE